jgi:hypothetical protein
MDGTSNIKSKKSDKDLCLKDRIIAHKKSCICVVLLIVVIIILVFVYAHNCPTDSFMSKYKIPWVSPDYKLRNKNHTNMARRSDNKEDDWNKSDFLKSVSRFNTLAAVNT